MSTVVSAKPEDFERVKHLLAGFNNPYIDEAAWKHLFTDHWNTGEGYCGTMLVEGDRVVGFLGLVFSRRTIGGKEERFCNLSSWIVQPEYRKKSLFLLLPVLRLKGITLTDFTPSREVYALLKKAGFRDLETHFRYLLPVPRLSGKIRISRVSTDSGFSTETFDSGFGRIVRDHESFGCEFIQVRSEFGDYELVLTRLIRRRPPFRLGVIHHASAVGPFRRTIGSVAARLCRTLRVNVLWAEERILGGGRIPFSVKKRLEWPQVYRSETLEPESVDSLYSERILLKI